MERIKKFYNEHKTGVIIGGAGALLGAFSVLAIAHNKQLQGMLIDGAEIQYHDDGSLSNLTVQYRNKKIDRIYYDKAISA